MMYRLSLLMGAALLYSGLLRGQSNPITSSVAKDYRQVRDFVIRSAEEMPAENYPFRPAPEVRTFGQLLAHIADDQYNLCAPVKGETRKAAYTDIEKSLSEKTELVPALKKAFAYCDAAYDSSTDASANEMVKFFKSDRSKFEMLNWNNWHTWEHYGNLSTYLRIKGLVPPSSQRTR